MNTSSRWLVRANSLPGGNRTCLLRSIRRGVASAARAVQEIARHELPSTEPFVEPPRSRQDMIKTAKPFSAFLTDTYQRQHDYLRISITEKCNLRCLYCMPEEGVPQSPPPNLLTTPEIFMISSTFVSQGVTKIRLTGGEPTVRKDILPLMHQIGSLRSRGLRELCLTTNGISLFRKLDSMVEAGLTGVNLSLDTLDPWQFQIMTRRKGFEAVMKSIDRILEMNKLGAGIKLKINCVVMRGMNDKEIMPFVELGREKDLEVRFIEYMPFDGNKWSKGKMLGYQEMLAIIRTKYPDVRKVQDHKNDTSKTYEIPGFVGRMGFITSMTHNFCGSCNRLRITSDGNLKVCLFGNAEVSLRDILRKSNNGEPIDAEAFEAMKQIEMNRRQDLPVASAPLGSSRHEQELLEVIGLAVKGKKEKHAGMGELENMKNRPMILIEETTAIPRPCRKLSRARAVPWSSIPTYLFGSARSSASGARLYSTRKPSSDPDVVNGTRPKLTHVTPSGSAHMVAISDKSPTKRTATAICTVYFSNATALPLILENRAKKGDVLGVARIAGIMAAKKTSDLIPLCHPISITHVGVELEACRKQDLAASNASVERTKTELGESCLPPFTGSLVSPGPGLYGSVNITATVSCDGKTGVEMEALTAASTAALTVYDMCKAVDKGMVIAGLKVTRKEGGKSGSWVEGTQVSHA
ncbi:molybdenum cofactor biosynthesis protein 1 B [Phlyctema vagabunda]|uniref:Molybdenum cofactor biosynthesis protein 1 B n=1 Tax=Phlyctema vagabunda TaxID=108571 RepID=A0ABR4PNT5_9HELO